MPTDDRCYNCIAHGDDSYIDENGKFVPVCDTCPIRYEIVKQYGWFSKEDER